MVSYMRRAAQEERHAFHRPPVTASKTRTCYVVRASMVLRSSLGFAGEQQQKYFWYLYYDGLFFKYVLALIVVFCSIPKSKEESE